MFRFVGSIVVSGFALYGVAQFIKKHVVATKEADQVGAAQSAMNQRIHVTVERETITMLVRGQQEKATGIPPTIEAEPDDPAR